MNLYQELISKGTLKVVDETAKRSTRQINVDEEEVIKLCLNCTKKVCKGSCEDLKILKRKLREKKNER